MLGHRVEPKGASHVFIVHGSECRNSTAHPTCTFDSKQTKQRKGVMYVINIESVMGTDWKVRSMLLQLLQRSWLPVSFCIRQMCHVVFLSF